MVALKGKHHHVCYMYHVTYMQVIDIGQRHMGMRHVHAS